MASAPERVLVVAHSYFPSDPRIRKEVDALVAASMDVEVLCLRDDGQPSRETVRGATVRRLPVRRHRGAGLATYLLEYLQFFLLALAHVSTSWLKRRHPVVQVHTLPDPLVLCALVPRLLGGRVLLDMHELMPEFFGSRQGLSHGHPAAALLRSLEQVSCRFAHRVITVSEPIRQALVRRGVPERKTDVIMNSAPLVGAGPDGDTDAMEAGRAGDFTLVYHGLVSELYDLRTAVDALRLVRDRGERARLRVIGDGPALEEVRQRARQREVEDLVSFEGYVGSERIPALVRTADAGLIPLADLPYMQYAMPTKLFECVALGVPVITSRMRTVRHYFDDDAVLYVPPEDAAALADAIIGLKSDPALRASLARNALQVARRLEWPIMAERYVAIVRNEAARARSAR